MIFQSVGDVLRMSLWAAIGATCNLFQVTRLMVILLTLLNVNMSVTMFGFMLGTIAHNLILCAYMYQSEPSMMYAVAFVGMLIGMYYNRAVYNETDIERAQWWYKAYGFVIFVVHLAFGSQDVYDHVIWSVWLMYALYTTHVQMVVRSASNVSNRPNVNQTGIFT